MSRRSRASVMAGGPSAVLRKLLQAGFTREQALAGAKDPEFVREALRRGARGAASRMPDRLIPAEDVTRGGD